MTSGEAEHLLVKKDLKNPTQTLQIIILCISTSFVYTISMNFEMNPKLQLFVLRFIFCKDKNRNTIELNRNNKENNDNNNNNNSISNNKNNDSKKHKTKQNKPASHKYYHVQFLYPTFILLDFFLQRDNYLLCVFLKSQIGCCDLFG